MMSTNLPINPILMVAVFLLPLCLGLSLLINRRFMP